MVEEEDDWEERAGEGKQYTGRSEERYAVTLRARMKMARVAGVEDMCLL